MIPVTGVGSWCFQTSSLGTCLTNEKELMNFSLWWQWRWEKNCTGQDVNVKYTLSNASPPVSAHFMISNTSHGLRMQRNNFIFINHCAHKSNKKRTVWKENGLQKGILSLQLSSFLITEHIIPVSIQGDSLFIYINRKPCFCLVIYFLILFLK